MEAFFQQGFGTQAAANVLIDFIDHQKHVSPKTGLVYITAFLRDVLNQSHAKRKLSYIQRDFPHLFVPCHCSKGSECREDNRVVIHFEAPAGGGKMQDMTNVDGLAVLCYLAGNHVMRGGQKRYESDFSNRLKAEMPQIILESRIAHGPAKGRAPDILLDNGIIELKTHHSDSDVFKAIGQILTYNTVFKKQTMILIFLDMPSSKHQHYRKIEKLCLLHGILLLPADVQAVKALFSP